MSYERLDHSIIQTLLNYGLFSWSLLLLLFSQQEPKLSCVTFLLKAFTWVLILTYWLTDLLTYLLTVGSSRHRHSHKQTALVTASFTKLGFLNSHTNSVFFTFTFPAVPVTDTFLMFRGCPLMRTSTLPTYVILTFWLTDYKLLTYKVHAYKCLVNTSL